MELKDKVAVVTGSGRGIGEGIAMVLAREGARLVIVDMNLDDAKNVAKRIESGGGKAIATRTDVSKKADVEAMVADAVKAFGTVDVLVNNAGIESPPCYTKDLREEDWDRVMNVTRKSQVLMSKAVAQQMIAQGGGGNIINVGSTSGWQGRRRAIAYSAAKGAIANFTRALALQLAPHNIRVNAIVPNKIGSPVGRDEFDPTRPVENMLKRPGQPDEAARAILFLASEDSSFIIGENLFVDGGTMAMDHTS